ncbi:MAG: DUF3365 domain-containing protein [Dechloromonas sp.]|jgi:two-component system NtrC family sensor kinase|nr:DUF3365 domain-containing protein [Dechloromonas sp.]
MPQPPPPTQTAALPDSGRGVPRLIRDRRWWLLPLALWTAATGLYLYIHIGQIREQTLEVALQGARNMFRMVVLTRNWNASHGGVYVPVTPATQPNPYLDHPQRDVTTTDGLQLTMINPAYMTRLIAQMAEAGTGVSFRLTSLRPLRPENQADDWEAGALRRFETGLREFSSLEVGPQGMALRYMAPLRVQQSCLACHAKQGYRIGDIRGGIGVSQPYAPIAAAMRQGIVETVAGSIATFLGVAGLGWLLLETLRRRWLELAGKMQELEQAQVQLLQSEKLASIGQLAAGVAHEINNPIGFVNSNLGTLKEYNRQFIELLEACRAGRASEADFAAIEFDYLKDDVADLLRESQSGLARVKKIVADLKDFSRVDQAEWHAADLNAGIESTLNVVNNELKYKADIVREYGELPPVICVAAQINQVVMNLLVNAAHAIEQHGTITVRTGRVGDEVWFEVADTGCGMAPDTVQHVFEPFFTTKPVGQGTGLGLSVSYDIVRKHGGRIDVDSQPGRGTRFRVTLPVDCAAATA